MKNVGKIIDLFVSQKDKSERVGKETLTLDTKGIVEDKFYDTNVQRSVLITSQESYTLASSHHIKMLHGSLGENVLIDYNPYHLTAGDQLRMGDVLLEISQYCTMCDHLSKIDKDLPTLLKNDRGIFAKVLEGGVIKKEDEIYLLS